MSEAMIKFAKGSVYLNYFIQMMVNVKIETVIHFNFNEPPLD
jgi:hypothetical protein